MEGGVATAAEGGMVPPVKDWPVESGGVAGVPCVAAGGGGMFAEVDDAGGGGVEIMVPPEAGPMDASFSFWPRVTSRCLRSLATT